MEELARTQENRVEQVEPGLHGIGTQPGFATGQRALVADGVLWDCITHWTPGSSSTRPTAST